MIKLNVNLITKRLIQTMSAWQIKSHSKELMNVLQLNNKLQVPMVRSPNEVIIKVMASSVNPLDVYMCNGYGHNLIGKLNFIDDITRAQKVSYNRYPLTLGRDISGVIVNKGSNVKFKIGDNVWGTSPPYKQGAHAQFVAVDQCDVRNSSYSNFKFD
jgi:zinc binding dehydrogenase, putative